MSRRILLLLPALLAPAACTEAPAQTGQARADAATVAACRSHADAVYNRNNRDTIYTISTVNTPYSTNYTPGLVDRGLPQRYGYETMTRDCIRNTGTETDRTPGKSAAEPAAPPPSSAKP